ncbi:MAG TPA: hypothetical protein VNS58_04690 [Puia sp.]|nr:hypothetical protein [Puia sp.]
MINRIFFISDKAVLSGDLLPPEENIYYSILADPLVDGSLEDAYTLITHSTHLSLALTLDIRERLTAERIRFITSFLFIPSYLTLEFRPVINLKGHYPELLREEAASLSAYFSLQGIPKPVFHIITGDEVAEGNGSFHSGEALAAGYTHLLRSEPDSYATIFFYPASGEILRSAFLSLQEAEMQYRREVPQLYSLIQTNRRLEKELHSLNRRYASTYTELNHQKQYLEILRSDHATKELQDYYNNEYEILPLWYKRFGHILKVLTGKRTFQSLFRDGVKKYKN